MTWEAIASNFKDAEPHKDRVRGDVSSGYQLKVHQLKGFSAMQTLSLHNVKYEFRVSFYDTVYKQFIGKTWKSKQFSPEATEDGSSVLQLNQALYFHTPYVDSTIVCVVEIVKVLSPKNPLPGQIATSTVSSMGWGIIRVLKVDIPLSTMDNSELQHKIMTVYHGSPRALLFMDDNIESNSILQPVAGCQLLFNYKKHLPLSKVFHLMPENVVFCGTDCLPGMAEQLPKTGQEQDNFVDPKPLKRQTCYIDNLSVSLGNGITIEKFEETLCQKINKDRFLKDMSTDDGKSVVVTERRMMIGVHNGYCYVHKPQFCELEPEALFGSRMGSFGRGKRTSPASAANKTSSFLVLRSRVTLDEMINDPEVAIVLQVEYQLAVPYSSQASVRGSAASLHSQSITVSVRWAAVTPFAQDRGSNIIKVQLKGPMSPNPDNVLFYSFHNSPDEDMGMMKFKFLTSKQQESFYDDSTSMLMQKTPGKPPIHPQSPAVSAGKYRQKSMIAHNLEDGGYYTDGNSHMVEITHLEEEDQLPPVHAPPLQSIAPRTQTLTRATYARLYSSGFPEIKDKDNRSAIVVDPLDHNLVFDIQVELQDILVANEIIFQFLAFSHPAYGPGETKQSAFSSIFCSFQFYRFESVTTNRMSLSKNSENQNVFNNQKHDSMHTFLLRKVHSGNQVDKGPPGLEIRYFVDPAHMKPGENVAFLKYLLEHSLHVDVWDGDSLLLIGSYSVPLKHLLRQRHAAVASNHEISVVSEEHSSVVPKLATDLSTPSGMKALGVQRINKGRIYMRAGCVGHRSEGIPKYDDEVGSRKNLVIADMSGCSFFGGSVSTARSNLQNSTYSGQNYCQVKRVVDCNKEISEMLLASDKEDTVKFANDDLSTEKATEESIRKRKLARMLAIRDMEKGNNSGSTLGKRALVNTQERSIKLRDLQTVDSYRSRLKSDHIKEILLLSITTQHTIRPSFGVTEFVELQIKNPFNSEHTITIECNCPELRVVTDSREWRYFKAASNLRTPVEENMFSFDNEKSLPQVFMRAKETLFIPFRYQAFEIQSDVQSVGPGQFFQPTKTTMRPVKGQNHGTIKSKIAKAILHTSDGKALSVLQLNIEPQPHVVDQTFRFYNPENNFIKKIIRLPPLRQQLAKEYTVESRLHVECSDVEVVCQTIAKNHNEPQEIYIKAACGASPSIKRFYVALYNDPFLSCPTQVWQIYVHALNRIDVSCVLGQKSKLSVVIRGTQTTRMVQCYPSDPSLMQISPSEPFMLSSNQMSELTIMVHATHAPASKYMHLHVVDVEYHQLVQAWLVVVNTKQPLVEKEFTVTVDSNSGQDCCKSIRYTNPYSVRKQFHVLTSRPELMTFVDNGFELAPGENFSIGMRITSRASFESVQTIYVFINDADDKNEETFAMNVKYIS